MTHNAAVEAARRAVELHGAAQSRVLTIAEQSEYAQISKLDIARALLTAREEAIEECAKEVEEPLAELVEEDRIWRDGFGKEAAQPNEPEIDLRKQIASAIRALGKEGGR